MSGSCSVAARRALVVDDSDAVRGVLRGMLEEAGLSVVEAASGAECLSHMRRDGSIGLVFLDLNMPGLGGRAVLAGMRSRRQTADLPVVILTGDAQPPDLCTPEQQGAQEWLHKPVDFDSLVRVAHHYLLPH